MSTMLVYRLETTDGLGPYNGGFYTGQRSDAQAEVKERLAEAHCNEDAMDTHPTPSMDPEMRNHHRADSLTDQYLFGFAYRSDLSAWFGGFGADLDAAGYVVSVYRAPREYVLAGRNQVAAHRQRMDLVRQYAPAKLIP
jgi:hypothetical protein